MGTEKPGDVAVRNAELALAALHRIARMVKSAEGVSTSEQYDCCIRYMNLTQQRINTAIWAGGCKRRKRPGPYAKYCLQLQGFLMDCIKVLVSRHFPDPQDAADEIMRIACMR